MHNRIANLRIGTPFPGDNAPAVRYYLEDHLGNCSFTLESNGAIFSREEYFPFGETSFGSFAKKRYRFCGKERDEESGMYYYGARYYAPWTCRFVSLDPLAGKYPFYTPYQYAGNKVIGNIDVDGLEPGGNQIQGPVGIDANTSSTTISGTIYITFDIDYRGAGNTGMMNQSAAAVQTSINNLLSSNNNNGIPITSNIQVIPVFPGFTPPNGAHVFNIGNGANARPETVTDQISYAVQGGKTGYIYQTQEGSASGHEFLHWLGLSDRYTEILFYGGAKKTGGTTESNTNNSDYPSLVWGRAQGNPTAIPLANVQKDPCDANYDPTQNAMSNPQGNGGSQLTQYQVDFIFNFRKGNEEAYRKDAIMVNEQNRSDYDKYGVVEFTSNHNASWWDPQTNAIVPKNQTSRGPSTIRNFGNRLFPNSYFGQNFIKGSVYYDGNRLSKRNFWGGLIANKGQANKAIFFSK